MICKELLHLHAHSTDCSLQLACYSEICCFPINNYLHRWSILLSVANEDLAQSLHYCLCRQFMKFHPFLTGHCTDLCSLVISSSWHNHCKVSLRGTTQSTDNAGVTWRSHTWTFNPFPHMWSHSNGSEWWLWQQDFSHNLQHVDVSSLFENVLFKTDNLVSFGKSCKLFSQFRLWPWGMLLFDQDKLT